MAFFRIRRMHAWLVASVCLALVGGCAMTSPRADTALLQQQVADTERAFARTMADRNFAAFQTFLSADTIFFSGPRALRGKQAVADAWKPFYEKPDAPFSWKPEQVEVLESGTLALSTGPVFDPTGRNIATYTSIWRMEAAGMWRIIFDKGNDVCDCPKAP